MPLAEPPNGAGALASCASQTLAGRTVFRLWRSVGLDGTARPSPWWFASVPDNPTAGGRFDLPSPMGTCYVATSAVGAVLEGLQAHLTSLPVEELRSRRLARVNAPDGAPVAARLTSRRLAGAHGVTAALWSGGNRLLTQRWAGAFRRDGWWALYGGAQHDPSGRLRSYAVFDHSGGHSPTAGGAWTHESTTPADDVALHQELITFGITVRAAGDLPFTTPP